MSHSPCTCFTKRYAMGCISASAQLEPRRPAMKLRVCSLVVGTGVLALLGAGASLLVVPKAEKSTAARVARAGQSHAVEGYGKLPLSFEANQGQTDGQVKFLVRGQEDEHRPANATGGRERQRQSERRGGTAGQEQLLHRQRPEEVAHEYSDVRQGASRGYLPRCGLGLLRQPRAITAPIRLSMWPSRMRSQRGRLSLASPAAAGPAQRLLWAAL